MLAESIFYALLFVVLVVFVFLGNWRATIIIGVTIPISLLTSFIYLMLADSSLNIISLASLTVAIGMVVDDAIVVLENISRHIERGASPREASIYATNEVWTSVIATTLVIVAVFVPLTMLSGMAGIMFKELGWIVTIVVCTSTIVAITLTPMLCSKMLKGKKFFLTKAEEAEAKAKEDRKRFTYAKTVGRAFDAVDKWYANVLRACLNHKALTIFTAVLIFALSLVPVFMGKIGTDFLHQQDGGAMSVTVELQRGTRIEETLKTARAIEADINRLIPEAVVVSTSAGTNDDAGIGAMFSSTTNSKISMTVRTTKKYDRERSIWQMAEVLRTQLATYPEIVNYQVSTSTGMGAGGDNSVSIEVYGYDFDLTTNFANDLKNRLQNVEGARDIKLSRDEDRAELQIIFNKEKLARSGLSSSTVATYVRNRVNGMITGYLKEEGEEYYIMARLQEEYRNSISDIEELSFMTATGAKIKLKEIAEVKEYWCPPQIERKNRQRYLTVSVTPYEVSLGEMAASISKVLDEMDIPQGIHVDIAGNYEEQQESFADMGVLAALIILLVYIVMASQFESFSKPFIIMMSIPFAITGVILALLVTGQTLDMVGALGVILLIGIVVKNGIVLVDYINLMRERDVPLKEAIALSGQSRLRPVLMTAFTTILGMVPMALSTSEGSEIWVTMGVVVIGGLLVSTIITLIVVPVLYAVFVRNDEKKRLEKIRKNFVFMQIDASEKE